MIMRTHGDGLMSGLHLTNLHGYAGSLLAGKVTNVLRGSDGLSPLRECSASQPTLLHGTAACCMLVACKASKCSERL